MEDVPLPVQFGGAFVALIFMMKALPTFLNELANFVARIRGRETVSTSTFTCIGTPPDRVVAIAKDAATHVLEMSREREAARDTVITSGFANGHAIAQQQADCLDAIREILAELKTHAAHERDELRATRDIAQRTYEKANVIAARQRPGGDA